MSDKYQGWANYPTWCIHLWITNDEPMYLEWTRAAASAVKATNTHKEARWLLRDQLMEHFNEAMEDDTTVTGFWHDLLGYALDQVDWDEVAESLLED